MTDKTVEIPVSSEGIVLEGKEDGPPSGAPAIVCHPHPAFGGTMDTELVAALATRLTSAGMHVLRFNFRGVGRSGGAGEGGLTEHRDVAAAARFLVDAAPRLAGRPAPDRAPVVAGYSFGALMAARAIAAGLHASAFAAIGLPTIVVADIPERVADMRAAIAAAPALLLTGDQDRFCSAERLRALADGFAHARVEVFPGVGHFPAGHDLDRMLDAAVGFLTLG